MRRREFITLVGAAAAWPIAARAQQPVMPVIGFLDPRSPDALADRLRAFHRGLKDIGYIERENVGIEYRWAENQMDRLPALAAELVRLRVGVIISPGGLASTLAAKQATTTIPIVFAVADDPVRLGLVASLGRPGGNLTGVNFFAGEVTAKRLEILRENGAYSKSCRRACQPGECCECRNYVERSGGGSSHTRIENPGSQRQHQPRNRGRLRNPWARSAGCTLGRHRPVL